MTCIIGITTDEGTLIASDSLGSNEFSKLSRLDNKIFKLNDVLFGVAGSYRISQILQYHLDIENYKHADFADYSVNEYIHKYLVIKIRQVLMEHGALKVQDGIESIDASILIAVSNCIFVMYSDLQIEISRYSFNSIGSGSDIANGILKALTKDDKDHSFYHRYDLLVSTLESVESFIPSVQGPFTYIANGDIVWSNKKWALSSTESELIQV